ncbi:MAG: thioredoxin [Muribaculaceae bacterium]|nr:thioredoxin [Muribaculaceae bacterium]
MATTFTDSNITEYIESGKPVIVDFWATWCGPCKAMSPLIDKLAEEFDGQIIVGKYNCDDETDFASDNRVMSLPTLLFFKNGEKTAIRLAGSQSYETLQEKAKELLAL